MSELFLYAAIAISIAGLIIATYTDLKARIVPNKLNYGLAVIGVALFAAQSIVEKNPLPVLYSLGGLAYGFVFGWILWKIGVFAGGDVKLFMGLGALNPLTPALAKAGLLGGASIPLFPITLFIYALVSFLPYGITMLIYRLAKNKKFQKELWIQIKPKLLYAIHAMLYAPAAYIIITYISAHYFYLPELAIIALSIATLILWGYAGKKKKYATIIAFILAAVINPTLLAQGVIGAMLASVIGYTLIRIMLASRKLLSSEIAVNKLEEGMIPAKSLAADGKKIAEVEGLSYGKIVAYGKARDFKAIIEMFTPKKEIISASKARGLTDDEIKEVKKLAAKGLIPKKMLIKESMPFVPTMLIGYCLCIVLGDLALKMILMGVL